MPTVIAISPRKVTFPWVKTQPENDLPFTKFLKERYGWYKGWVSEYDCYSNLDNTRSDEQIIDTAVSYVYEGGGNKNFVLLVANNGEHQTAKKILEKSIKRYCISGCTIGFDQDVINFPGYIIQQENYLRFLSKSWTTLKCLNW